jgi:hypothetical protein
VLQPARQLILNVRPGNEDMPLREQISEQIRQNRRPLRICGAIAGGLMFAPLVFAGKMHVAVEQGVVILALAGGVLIIVLAITKGENPLPKMPRPPRVRRCKDR